VTLPTSLRPENPYLIDNHGQRDEIPTKHIGTELSTFCERDPCDQAADTALSLAGFIIHSTWSMPSADALTVMTVNTSPSWSRRADA
jgi:hypothetical protein